MFKEEQKLNVQIFKENDKKKGYGESFVTRLSKRKSSARRSIFRTNSSKHKPINVATMLYTTHFIRTIQLLFSN